VPNFDLIHWERFAPNLGNNRQLVESEQLTLELAVGMTKVQLSDFFRALTDSVSTPEQAEVDRLLKELGDDPGKTLEAMTTEAKAAAETALREASEKRDAAYAAKLSVAWAPFARLAPGDHHINGQPLKSLANYLHFVRSQAGRYNFIEIQDEVTRLNSVEGSRALFSDAPSGGRSSTRTQRGAAQPAGR